MDTIHVYRDDAGEYRWRRVAPNGRTVSDSGEGYTRLGDAAGAAQREAHGDAHVVVEGERSNGDTAA
jgi:uncharacterized protein YegP (UPF0339 family)